MNTLTELVDRSWLKISRVYPPHFRGKKLTRFSFNNGTLLEYARQLCTIARFDKELIESRSKHLAYYGMLLATRGAVLRGEDKDKKDGQLVAAHELRSEQDDMLLALEYPEDSSWLVVMTEQLRVYFDIFSDFLLMTSVYESLMTRAIAWENRALQIQSAAGLVVANIRTSNLDAAMDNLKLAKKLLKNEPNHMISADLALYSGFIQHLKNKHKAAARSFRSANRLAIKAGDRYCAKKALGNLGLVRWREGRYDEARNMFKRTIEIDRELGDQFSESKGLVNLGTVEQEVGNYVDAEKLIRKAIALQRKLGDKADEGLSLIGLGIIAYQQGNYELARRRYNSAYSIFRRIGSRVEAAHCLNNLALIEYVEGNLEMAERQSCDALALFLELADVTGEMLAKNCLATIVLMKGEHARAGDLYDEVLDIARRFGLTHYEAIALANMGHVQLVMNSYDVALEYYCKSAAVNHANENKLGTLVVCGLAGSALTLNSQFLEGALLLLSAQNLLSVHEQKYDPVEQLVYDKGSRCLDRARQKGLVSKATLKQIKERIMSVEYEELIRIVLAHLKDNSDQ